MTADNRYLHLIRQDWPLPPGTHVVVYCRDSGGDEQDRSITQQIDVAREYCLHHSLVLNQVYVDESKLSSNTEKRDQLQEMLSDLRRRFKHINDRYKREKATREKPFGVIFWKSKRIMPDPEMWDRCYLAWEMRHEGASYREIHKATRLFKNINGYDTFFSNPVYTGDLEYGGKLYQGFVTAMIPKDWFEAEQKRRVDGRRASNEYRAYSRR